MTMAEREAALLDRAADNTDNREGAENGEH